MNCLTSGKWIIDPFTSSFEYRLSRWHEHKKATYFSKFFDIWNELFDIWKMNCLTNELLDIWNELFDIWKINCFKHVFSFALFIVVDLLKPLYELVDIWKRNCLTSGINCLTSGKWIVLIMFLIYDKPFAIVIDLFNEFGWDLENELFDEWIIWHLENKLVDI